MYVVFRSVDNKGIETLIIQMLDGGLCLKTIVPP